MLVESEVGDFHRFNNKLKKKKKKKKGRKKDSS
jgi:hypothetical protein